MTRSENMARIRGRDTSPELLLRKALWADGLRYRLRVKTPAGFPDIVFPGAKVAVYVDGCQWHGCPSHYVRPRTRCEFWAEKLAAAVERDIRQTAALEQLGWRVVRVWEHDVHESLCAVVEIVRSAVRSPDFCGAHGERAVRVETTDTDGQLERWCLVGLGRTQCCHIVTKRRQTSKWRNR
ncbi:MAG: very short patch repair endonuclease [Burkholderiales bacterium]|nr:very short patch repair endonuclease [Burkholderiales bacterium]